MIKHEKCYHYYDRGAQIWSSPLPNVLSRCDSYIRQQTNDYQKHTHILYHTGNATTYLQHLVIFHRPSVPRKPHLHAHFHICRNANVTANSRSQPHFMIYQFSFAHVEETRTCTFPEDYFLDINNRKCRCMQRCIICPRQRGFKMYCEVWETFLKHSSVCK